MNEKRGDGVAELEHGSATRRLGRGRNGVRRPSINPAAAEMAATEPVAGSGRAGATARLNQSSIKGGATGGKPATRWAQPQPARGH